MWLADERRWLTRMRGSVMRTVAASRALARSDIGRSLVCELVRERKEESAGPEERLGSEDAQHVESPRAGG